METDTQLAPPPGQRLLFSTEIEELVSQREEVDGIYTGERFEQRRPDAARATRSMLELGVPHKRIAQMVGCHHLTVSAYYARHHDSIDPAQRLTVGQMRAARQLQIDRLLENPDLVPGQGIGMLLDQLTRNIELLDGRATSRVESFERVDVHGDWEAILGQLVSEKELPADYVREIGSSIGSGGEEKLTIEPDSADLVYPRTADARADVESDDITSEIKPDLATNEATSPLFDLNSLPAAAADGALGALGAEGGGGGPAQSPGLADPIQQPGQEFLSNTNPPPATR